MAQVVEENIVIRVSKLVKNNDSKQTLVSEETIQALEQVAQELMGDGVIVEVELA